MYEKTFQLSSRTPQIPLNVLSRTRLLFLPLKLMSYIKFQNNCFKINAKLVFKYKNKINLLKTSIHTLAELTLTITYS